MAAQWTHIIPNGASRSLSPDGKGAYVTVAFGGDASLRQRLTQEPGAVADGGAVLIPADSFVPGEQFTESIVSKRLKAAAQEAVITKRIYPHLLRHSFATHLIDQGTDLKIVKELMGHNSIRTTEIYVHIADTFKSNIKSPLDDILEEDGL